MLRHNLRLAVFIFVERLLGYSLNKEPAKIIKNYTLLASHGIAYNSQYCVHLSTHIVLTITKTPCYG